MKGEERKKAYHKVHSSLLQKTVNEASAKNRKEAG